MDQAMEVMVQYEGVGMKVSIVLLDDIAIGDYLLVHAGCSIEKLDKEQGELHKNYLINYLILNMKESKAPKGYILSKEQIKVNVKSPETQKFTVKNEDEKLIDKVVNILPNTGNIFDYTIIIIIGTLIIIIGMSLLLKRDKVS